MDLISIPYAETNYFSKIIRDYLEQKEELRSFYSIYPSLDNFSEIINNRSQFEINRELLAKVMASRYQDLDVSEKVASNIELLKSKTTFTVTTAHQPNLFTGPLYFIYKIISAINLAEQLKQKFPDNDFVPVYCMGEEDHDFEELNHFYLFGKKYEWEKPSEGAVGRMSTSDLASLIDQIDDVLGESENSKNIIASLKESYKPDSTIGDATHHFVNWLFGGYGLVIFRPDDSRYKRAFIPRIKDELFKPVSSDIVNESIRDLEQTGYKSQANPREINFFYLKDKLRNRIVSDGNGGFEVVDTDISFSKDQMENEVEEHPECFSPNVILRGMYQETLLPNLVYIGGGGELAYWLQYRKLFEHYKVPMPALLLRNSVLWIEDKQRDKLKKMDVDVVDLFLDIEQIVNRYVEKNAEVEVELKEERKQLETLFDSIEKKAVQRDKSLEKVVGAERQKSLNSLEMLEKRLLKSEKQRFEVSTNQLRSIHAKLFPAGKLQERYSNFLQYYVKYGDGFIETLKQHLDPTNVSFSIIID